MNHRPKLRKIVLGLGTFLLTVPIAVSASNRCYCEPTSATSKRYVGEARQKKLIGYEINFVCEYRCDVFDSEDQVVRSEILVGEHHERYYKSEKSQESGLEGICDGLEYRPEYQPRENREVYTSTGKTTAFSPMLSTSPTLKNWGQANDCFQPASAVPQFFRSLF